MFETVKEVDEETIIKEHITPLSKDETTSLQNNNFEDLGDINDLIKIKAVVTKIFKNVQFKDNNVYLFNDIIDNLQDKLPENVRDDDNKRDENIEK